MILLLDTSTPICRLELHGDGRIVTREWQADRQLAKGLLRYLDEQLRAENKTFNDITGIGALRGPGSFTGLRIGLTVLNTIASAQHIPIVGTSGDDWRKKAMQRLHDGDDDRIVMPEYGGDAHITAPRK